MTVHKSDQVTTRTAAAPDEIPTSEWDGKVRRRYFSFTVPAGDAAIADTIQLCTVKSGWRLLDSYVTWEGMTTGGAAATMEIGDGVTAAKYLTATSVDADGASAWLNSVSRNFGEKVTSAFTLTATVSVEAWAATKKLLGYITYIAD